MSSKDVVSVEGKSLSLERKTPLLIPSSPTHSSPTTCNPTSLRISKEGQRHFRRSVQCAIHPLNEPALLEAASGQPASGLEAVPGILWTHRLQQSNLYILLDHLSFDD